MTPLRFEELYGGEWAELEALLDQARGRPAAGRPPMPGGDRAGARLPVLYRRACEQLALARARTYPAYLIDRLERLTADAHQLIYHRPEYGWARLVALFSVHFPAAVRQQWRYVAVSAATFAVPAVVLGLLVFVRPELILSVVSSETAAEFEEMYAPTAESFGRSRDASTDWVMFGYYIRNNISVAFQCFAGGMFAGLGSLFFLAFNGGLFGALAGYLTARGLAETFFSFVVTHASFEVTAIVLSGAAGLRIGHALLHPGRQTRKQSLVTAAGECTVILYGVTAMLLAAAAIEAFWSSANWLPATVKYGVASLCWVTVLGYLTMQGRRAG